jgi:hypothetical protein
LVCLYDDFCMSIHLALDESLITIAPTLDDIEPILKIRTRHLSFQENEGGADGVLYQVGKRGRKALPFTPDGEGRASLHTSLPARHCRVGSELEVRTVCLAGGVGEVFYCSDRFVRLSPRWYGEGDRYLELRIQVEPGAEIVANRGMAPLAGPGEVFNYLGSIRNGGWVELHYDNHAHTGLSMSYHPSSDPFLTWHRKKGEETSSSLRSESDRWSKILNDD